MPERLKSMPNFACIGDNDILDLWPAPDVTGYTAQNELGSARASELIEVIKRTRAPDFLIHVIEAIARRGQFGALESGFFHALSNAMTTPHIIHEFTTAPPEREFKVARQAGHMRLVALAGGQDDQEENDDAAKAA